MAVALTPTRKRLVRDSSNDISLNMTLHSIQNDEEERHQRRQSLAPKHVSSNKKNISQEEAKNHYELCKKMFFENKITPKNAWDLRIIYFFTSVVDTNVSEKDHFQQVASTLEICTKVYSCRVDDLHAEGVKLANTLASQEDLGEDNQEDDNNDNQRGSKRKSKKKRSRLAASNTECIAKEMESLLGPIPKISGVPFNIETKGDPERTVNLYTNTVPFDQSYKEHLNDKEAACFLTYNLKDDDPNAEIITEDAIEKVVPKVKGLRLCAEFENFEVNVVDCDLNTTRGTNLSFGQPNITQHQSVFDQHGHPIVTLDGSMHDIFDNQDDGGCDMAGSTEDGVVIEEVEGRLANGLDTVYHEVHVVSFCPGGEKVSEPVSTANDMKENVSQWLNTMLVGPSHWKNKLLKRSVSRYSGAVEEKKPMARRRAEKKIDQEIDFFGSPPKIDFNAKVKVLNRTNTDESKFILPKNYLKRCRNSDLLMLMNYIPEKTYSAPKENLKENDEEANVFTHECNDYNYDNLNDSQYCLAGNNEENGHDDAPLNENDNETNIQNSNLLNNVQNDLLGQTMEEEVRNLHIADPANLSIDAVVDVFELPPYAMKSKKINMKRIKATMLKLLGESGVLLEKVASDDLEHLKIQRFSSVYSDLTRNLPVNMSKEMTPAIAFFAILHLTNENGLHLKPSMDLKDAFISNEIHVQPHTRK
ncbi:condensin complex subunit 2 isoform X1 [Onthophagus taurus]|uniref:condensin complex subunit 2 isoform X1 n=1 Tax=Onthophagus taurus TaxID=166361 RepID=UPI0039BE4D8A